MLLLKESSLLPSALTLPLPPRPCVWHKCHKCASTESSSTNSQRQVHKECGLLSSQSASFCYFTVLCVVPGWILRAKQHPRAAEGALAAAQDSAQPPWIHFVLHSLEKLWPSNLPKKLQSPELCYDFINKDISLKGELLSNRRQSWKAGRLQLSSVPDCRDVITPSLNHQYLSSPWTWPFSSLCSRYLYNMGHRTLMSYNSQTAGRTQPVFLEQTDEHVLLEKWK